MLFSNQNKNIHSKSNGRGFSLVETVIYISLMTVILASLFYLISSASRTYNILKSSRSIERSAINIINNIGIQADSASKIDITNTSFDNNQGALSLISYDGIGNSTTTKIFLSNNQAVYSQNNVVVGPLSLSDVRVTKMEFKNMSTSTFNGFKVELTIDNGSSSEEYSSENFYNSYILR